MVHAIKQSKLPSTGTPLDVYYTTDTKQTYVVLGDGVLLNLNDLLKGGNTARVVGPQGEAGPRGPVGSPGAAGRDGCNGKDSSVPGPRGERGERGASVPGPAGRDGRDGKDSTVPGPRGEIGPRGERGDKGEPADITVVGDAELQAAVAKLKQQKAAALASIAVKLEAMGNHPVYRVAKSHLEDVKKELA